MKGAQGAPAGAQVCRLRILRVKKWGGRLRGLLCRRRPRPGVGLWLSPCRAVHTFGMTYALDVVFLDRHGRVAAVVPALRPWRVALCLRAVSVVELEAGAVDFEHGGIGRIEAAIQDAERRNADGNLHRIDQGLRDVQGNQGAGAEIDAQEYRRPGQSIDQERPLVAPARDTGKEQRLRQPDVVPGHQHRGMPEQGADDQVQGAEDQQCGMQRLEERHVVVGDRRRPDAVRELIGERHEGDQPGQHAQAGVHAAQDKQLFQDAGLLQGLEPHGRQHGAVGVDVFARRQRHQRDAGHQCGAEERADGHREHREQQQEADDERPGEQRQWLTHEQPEPLSRPLPSGGCW
ncbi:hypothetical protein CAL26_09410 [Bordetella genomosp. 9]|uniref:DUF192 domain-containing protein n=1 Tax=Bordetella genomosp. 9 TaxID=1416803 RepID=A0A261RGY5_9BORD|nr:hypothetical protein CAL26_09410 [Bordetella genomosp. 9]